MAKKFVNKAMEVVAARESPSKKFKYQSTIRKIRICLPDEDTGQHICKQNDGH